MDPEVAAELAAAESDVREVIEHVRFRDGAEPRFLYVGGCHLLASANTVAGLKVVVRCDIPCGGWYVAVDEWA